MNLQMLKNQYLMRWPFRSRIVSILFGIVSITLSMSSLENDLMTLAARLWNCKNVSLVIFLVIESFWIAFRIRWKTFSMQFTSGLRGGIFIRITPFPSSSSTTAFEFIILQLSCIIRFSLLSDTAVLAVLFLLCCTSDTWSLSQRTQSDLLFYISLFQYISKN